MLNALESKGFCPRPGDHKFLVYYDLCGKKTQVRTKVSHGSEGRSIDSFLVGQMARQCQLSKDDFIRLVDCSMDRGEYDNIIRDRGPQPLYRLS